MKPNDSKLKTVAVKAKHVSVLEAARTLEDHTSIFKRYGVLWWWRLKNDPRWTKAIWKTVGRKGSGDSLNSFEGVAEIPVVRAMWPFHVLFDYHYEQSAFLYEMNARITGKFEKYEFDRPWSELTPKQMDELANRWPMDKAGIRNYELNRSVWTVALPGTKPNPGWTDYRNISWNLHYNDAKLVRQFKDMLTTDREQLGIQPRVNEGARHRGLSWRPIELIDQKQFEQKAWTDGERSQVSKAIKEAKRVFNSTSD